MRRALEASAHARVDTYARTANVAQPLTYTRHGGKPASAIWHGGQAAHVLDNGISCPSRIECTGRRPVAMLSMFMESINSATAVSSIR